MIPGPEEVYGALDARFPFDSAYDWDNSGWQIRGTRPVGRCVVALDPSPEAVLHALETNADLLVTHHPLYFPHISTLDPDTPAGAVTRILLAEGVGLLAAHTSADRQVTGVSGALADALGLQAQEILAPDEEGRFFKLVTYVPDDALIPVRDALTLAGAGRIGNYTECSFALAGTGTFRPMAGAKPVVGQVGDLEVVNEMRLEVRVSADRLEDVLAALRETHPYDEAAFDLFPTFGQGGDLGIGVIGAWEEPLDLDAALAKVKAAVGGVPLRVTGPEEGEVQVVAVAGGSTSEFIAAAAARGAGLFVGGDLKYHDLIEHATEMVCVDPGHRASEQPGVERLAAILRSAATRNEWKMEVTTYHEDPAVSRIV